MRRMGVVLSAQGAPLGDRDVTVRDWATGAIITTLETNAAGRWEIDLPDETKQYWIEAGYGGSSTQLVVQTPASIELEHLFVRHGAKLPAGSTIGGAPIDTSYVKKIGDTMSGELVVDSVAPAITLRESDAPANNRVMKILQPSGDGRLRIQAYTDAGVGGASVLDIIRAGSALTEIQFGGGMQLAAPLTVNNGPARGGSVYTGGVIFQTGGGPAPFGDAHLRVSGGDSQDYHGELALQANRFIVGQAGLPFVTIDGSSGTVPLFKASALAAHGVRVFAGFYTEGGAVALGATRTGVAFQAGVNPANVAAGRHFVTHTVNAYDANGAFIGYIRIFDTSN